MRLSFLAFGSSLLMLVITNVKGAENYTFDDVKKLPAIAEQLNKLQSRQRIDWLRAQIKHAPSSVKQYQLQRILAMELFDSGLSEETRQVCQRASPLRDDFVYRNYCTDVLSANFEAYKSQMQQLVFDTRQAENDTLAAQLLGNLAWRQSQEGDIAGAFASYESALSIAPNDNSELMSSILFDTATNYIVHGDSAYIKRGLELLARIRSNAQKAIAQQTDANIIKEFEFEIALTYFNSGIAYMLHLYDNEKALESFSHVNDIDEFISVNSLSFSALAAAELGYFKKSQDFINRVNNRKDQDPVVEAYLQCYRQLAQQYWQPNQSLSACLSLDPKTTIEVKVDLYKRLSKNRRADIKLYGLEQLRDLYIKVLEPQIRNKGSLAASNVELKRLQRESELKSLVLEKEKQLNEEKNARFSSQRNFFVALFFIVVFFFLLLYSQLRQKRKLAEQYHQMSIRDSLTQLGNRRFLEQQIERELAFVARSVEQGSNITLGVYILDIDHFKQINDKHGHFVGDEVLKQFGKRIKSIIRETDLLVRWGGEEFVFVARLDSTERMKDIANRILSQINRQPFAVGNGVKLDITCTIGVVQFPFIDVENTEVWTRLISLADAALYYGKAKGRNCWVVVTNETINSLEKLEAVIHTPLEQAIKQGLVGVMTSLEDDESVFKAE